MRKLLSAIGAWITKVESWWSFAYYVMGTSIFTWLGLQWDLIASQGWAATVFIAVIASAVLAIAFSLIVLAAAHLRRPKVPQVAGGANIPQISAGPTSSADFHPEGRSFKNQKVVLSEIVPDALPVLDGYIFDSCMIQGPAMLLLNGGQFLPKTRVLDTNDIDHFLVEVTKGRKVGGVIQMNNCVFRNCTFRWVGFVGEAQQIGTLRKMFAGQKR